MTNINHKDLSDPKLHEPKGVSTAVSGTVYVANGAGSGSFTPIGNVGKKDYSRTKIVNNTTSFAVSAATDSALHTSGDYVAIPSSIIIEDIKNGITFDINHSFVVATSGIYLLNLWVSISSTGTGNTVGISFAKNAIPQVTGNAVPKTKLKVAGDIVSSSFFGLFNLAVGDVISLVMADDTGSTVTIHEGEFTLNFISTL